MISQLNVLWLVAEIFKSFIWIRFWVGAGFLFSLTFSTFSHFNATDRKKKNGAVILDVVVDKWYREVGLKSLKPRSNANPCENEVIERIFNGNHSTDDRLPGRPAMNRRNQIITLFSQGSSLYSFDWFDWYEWLIIYKNVLYNFYPLIYMKPTFKCRKMVDLTVKWNTYGT